MFFLNYCQALQPYSTDWHTLFRRLLFLAATAAELAKQRYFWNCPSIKLRYLERFPDSPWSIFSQIPCKHGDFERLIRKEWRLAGTPEAPGSPRRRRVSQHPLFCRRRLQSRESAHPRRRQPRRLCRKIRSQFGWRRRSFRWSERLISSTTFLK